MGNECCRCDCEQDKLEQSVLDISIITQSEVGEDNNWRGFQPGYEQSGKYLTAEYVKQASYLIDTFDDIQNRHKVQKFEEYNSTLETATITRDSQRYSLNQHHTHLGRRNVNQQQKNWQRSRIDQDYQNSDEKLKRSFFEEEKAFSDQKRCSLNDSKHSQNNCIHPSHMSSSYQSNSNRSLYSNSVIKYGI